MIRLEIELDCGYDMAYRIKKLVEDLLDRNIEPKYKLLKGYKTTVKIGDD